MGSHHRNGKHLAAEDIAGSYTASDNGGPGSVDAGIRTLGTAEAKLHHPILSGGVDNPGGLCGNQGLMV